MKNFFGFFKTTAGIIILVLLILAIILIWLNWDTIKAWWNNDTDVEAPPVPETDNERLASRQSFMNIINSQYQDNPSWNRIQAALSAMSNDQLAEVANQKTVWCVCGNTDYGFTTNCQLACA